MALKRGVKLDQRPTVAPPFWWWKIERVCREKSPFWLELISAAIGCSLCVSCRGKGGLSVQRCKACLAALPPLSRVMCERVKINAFSERTHVLCFVWAQLTLLAVNSCSRSEMCLKEDWDEGCCRGVTGSARKCWVLCFMATEVRHTKALSVDSHG